jgi:hypothetical protein
MRIFRRKQEPAVVKAAADGLDQGKLLVRQRLATERPEMLTAIDAIESSNSLEDLDAALQRLCDAYEPLFEEIVSFERSKRLAYLLSYGGVWYDPAMKKGGELVRARTGRNLKPGELGDRTIEIAKRDTPGYSPFENPMPPRIKCRNMMLAIQSYS